MSSFNIPTAREVQQIMDSIHMQTVESRSRELMFQRGSDALTNQILSVLLIQKINGAAIQSIAGSTPAERRLTDELFRGAFWKRCDINL